MERTSKKKIAVPPSPTAPPGSTVDLDAAERAAVGAWLDEFVARGNKKVWEVKLTDLEAGSAIAIAKPALARRFAMGLLEEAKRWEQESDQLREQAETAAVDSSHMERWSAVWLRRQAAQFGLRAVLGRKLPLTAADLMLLVEWQAASESLTPLNTPLSVTINSLMHFAAKEMLPPSLVGAMRRLAERWRKQYPSDEGNFAEKLDRLATLYAGAAAEPPSATESGAGESHLRAFVTEMSQKNPQYHDRITPDSLVAGRAILALAPAEQVRVVLATLDSTLGGAHNRGLVVAVWNLRSQLLRRKLPFTEVDVATIALWLDGRSRYTSSELLLVLVVEGWAKEHGLTEQMIRAMRRMSGRLAKNQSDAEGRRMAMRIDAMIGNAQERKAAVSGGPAVVPESVDDAALMARLDAIIAGAPSDPLTEHLKPDDFPLAPGDDRETHATISEHLKVAIKSDVALAELRRDLAKCDDAVFARRMMALVLRMAAVTPRPWPNDLRGVPRALVMLENAAWALFNSRSKELPLTAGECAICLRYMIWTGQWSRWHRAYRVLLNHLTTLADAGPLPGSVSMQLEAMSEQFRPLKRYETDQVRTEIKLLTELLGRTSAEVTLPVLRGEAWTDAAHEDLKGMSAEARRAWRNLLLHCGQASAGSPTAKWMKAAGELIATITPAVAERLRGWLALAAQTPLNERIVDINADVLKGLVWCSSLIDDAELTRRVAELAISMYRKVPGVGPRCVRVGNACVTALGAMPGKEALSQIALLKVRVKFGTAQKLIEKALSATAERMGLPRDEIEELAAPTYGLEEVGRRRETWGEYTAELRVRADGAVIEWSKAGKAQKSTPAAVKKDFADDLKELTQAAKDIDKMLPAQRERIDGLFLEQKNWAFPVWRQRYLDHPLVGVIACGLIWTFTRGTQSADAAFLDGRLVTRDDQPVDWLDADSSVRLWHPIDQPMEAVTGWRDWLERHQVRQPFKQAHREIYILTDAERNTGVYSNRYAAHILRQHQYSALCAQRGWKHKLRLLVDDTYPPTTRALPKWNLRTEFWVEGAGSEYGRDTNESGVFLQLATDQVRFYPMDAPQLTAHAYGGGFGPEYGERADDQPLALDRVPPLVFSEIMRDIDLFVGVASIGNDPAWQDGGRAAHDLDYWRNYSFGDLQETARTRKAVLERLIPRLKIAPRCAFDDKFLIVRGDLRTYKIHLGSANILMTPNDQYLCIVADRGVSAGKALDAVYLPFDGDSRLSVIVSKALMLADDTKITDPTITRQIGRK